jgi:hypothetical protein
MNDNAVPHNTVEQMIAHLEWEGVQAYVQRDIATLERRLPYDFLFTRTLEKAFNKPQLIEVLTSGELTFESYERHVTNVSVYANTAVATGHDNVKGQYKGRDISGRYHFNSIYVEREGLWEVISAHAYRIESELLHRSSLMIFCFP